MLIRFKEIFEYISCDIFLCSTMCFTARIYYHQNYVMYQHFQRKTQSSISLDLFASASKIFGYSKKTVSCFSQPSPKTTEKTIFLGLGQRLDYPSQENIFYISVNNSRLEVMHDVCLTFRLLSDYICLKALQYVYNKKR